MTPQELYREERRKHQRVEDRRWREHLAAVEQQEAERGNRHRMSQGEGPGRFEKSYRYE